MRQDGLSRSWRTAMGVGAAVLPLLLAAGCVAGPSSTPAMAIAAVPGAARIWFYRDFEPSISLNLAGVALNGMRTGYVQPDGSAFYRDVAPGHYRITVETAGVDVNQDRDIDLAAGQEAFVKILASGSWDSGGDKDNYQRDTFYVSLVPPQVARVEMANRPLTGG